MPTTVLIVDGLRPDALDLARCPHINSLRARRTYAPGHFHHTQHHLALSHDPISQRPARPAWKHHQRLEADGTAVH